MAIEKRIKDLKAQLSRINTIDLLDTIGCILIPKGNDGKSVANSANIFKQTNLLSPVRQFQYICGLMLSTDYDESNKVQLTDSRFKDLERRVNDITSDYGAMHIGPMINGTASQEDIRRLSVSYAAFTSYFDTGKLNFVEQVAKKITRLFSQFDQFLVEEYSLSTKDFVDIYEAICDLDEQSVNEYCGFVFGLQTKINELESEMQEEVVNKCADPESLLRLLGDRISSDDSYMSKPTNPHTVRKSDLVRRFDAKKVEAFLRLFSVKRGRKDFCYYTDANPMTRQPLVELSEGAFFVTFRPWIIEAIYDFLNDTISRVDSFAHKKGAAVEEMAFDLLHKAFGDEAKYYRNVCEAPKTNEHDMLITYGNYIFVVEIKGSKVRPPAFNPEKSYTAVRDHFCGSNGIGGAYQQAIKLKKFIELAPAVTLYAEHKNPFVLSGVNKRIIPIVLTLEFFGSLEINTSDLIEPEEGQPYPWACCLDDLENLIRVNEYLSKDPDEFIRYINFRVKHHSMILASDELEIQESFYNNAFKRHAFDRYILCPMGNLLIDKIYFEEKGVPYDYKFSISVEPITDTQEYETTWQR